jgi:RNA polymerase sigma-70 factor (ECF subfamily)
MAALLKRIASGDESAFATLYDTTSALIYGLLLRIFGNSKTAEQVLVAVYQEVWQQATTYDEEHEKPMTWLITLAHSNAIARLKAGRGDQERQAHRLKIAEPVLATNSDTDEMISDEQRIVRSAFTALPPVQQQVIELAYFSGLRQNEIAVRLSLSLQSVQAGMRAGMMKLCDAFKSHQPYSA